MFFGFRITLYGRQSSAKIRTEQVIDVYQEQDRYKFCTPWNSRCDRTIKHVFPSRTSFSLSIFQKEIKQNEYFQYDHIVCKVCQAVILSKYFFRFIKAVRIFILSVTLVLSFKLGRGGGVIKAVRIFSLSVTFVLSFKLGGARFSILGGQGGSNSQQAHDVVLMSMRRNDVVSASFRRHAPTRFFINQCQIITFLILKSDNIEKEVSPASRLAVDFLVSCQPAGRRPKVSCQPATEILIRKWIFMA